MSLDVREIAESYLRSVGLPTDDLVLDPDDSAVREGLAAMRQAGCSYAYVGIESMSDQVMSHVHKNIRRNLPWKERVRSALSPLKQAGIRVCSSVLFGLAGEDQFSIEETIEEIARLIKDRYLGLASPNILTYHPGTLITKRHGMVEHLDYSAPGQTVPPPYSYFEEAYPGVVSKLDRESK